MSISKTKENLILAGILILSLAAAWLLLSFIYDGLHELISSRYRIAASSVGCMGVLFALVRFKQKYLAFALFCMLLSLTPLLLYEQHLREMAFVPWKEIKGLKLVNDFYGDERGIYVANPEEYPDINSFGFRGRELDNPGCDSTRPKVMFLGDSFTWGARAEPMHMCFADQVDSAGYCVINTGICGADPQQYALVTETYLDLVKPDIVLLMLCMDNDVMDCERVIKPNHPMMYAANGVINGLLLEGYQPNTCPRLPFEDFENAKIELARQFLMYEPSLMGNTVIGTNFMKQFKMPPNLPDDFSQPEYSVADKFIQQTDDLCREAGIPLWVYIIPHRDSIVTDVNLTKKNTDKLFKEYDSPHIYCPHPLTIDEYAEPPDAHLNNAGHRRFADDMVERMDRWFSVQRNSNEVAQIKKFDYKKRYKGKLLEVIQEGQ